MFLIDRILVDCSQVILETSTDIYSPLEFKSLLEIEDWANADVVANSPAVEDGSFGFNPVKFDGVCVLYLATKQPVGITPQGSPCEFTWYYSVSVTPPLTPFKATPPQVYFLTVQTMSSKLLLQNRSRFSSRRMVGVVPWRREVHSIQRDLISRAKLLSLSILTRHWENGYRGVARRVRQIAKPAESNKKRLCTSSLFRNWIRACSGMCNYGMCTNPRHKIFIFAEALFHYWKT